MRLLERRFDNLTLLALVLCVTLLPATPPAASAASKAGLSVPAVEAPIALDGSDRDWQGQPMTYLEESVRVLGAVHDASYLYVMFRFADETLARRISRFGVTLWLNSGKGHATDYGLRFVGSGTIPEMPRGDVEARSGSPTPQGFGPPDASAAGPPPGQLAIVRGDVADLQPAGAPDGPAAASATNEGLTCYEFRIPIADIPGLALPASAAEAHTVALGIQIGGPQLGRDGSLRGSADGAAGGMGGPGAGFGGGMGRPGGGMGGRRGPGGRQSVAKPVWVELLLTPAPTPQ